LIIQLYHSLDTGLYVSIESGIATTTPAGKHLNRMDTMDYAAILTKGINRFSKLLNVIDVNMNGYI
jgi:hypothetical protein